MEVTGLSSIRLLPLPRLNEKPLTRAVSCDYDLFEGTEVTGSREIVIRRGEVLVENDELVGRIGDGRLVLRARVGEELKPAVAAL